MMHTSASAVSGPVLPCFANGFAPGVSIQKDFVEFATGKGVFGQPLSLLSTVCWYGIAVAATAANKTTKATAIVERSGQHHQKRAPNINKAYLACKFKLKLFCLSATAAASRAHLD